MESRIDERHTDLVATRAEGLRNEVEDVASAEGNRELTFEAATRVVSVAVGFEGGNGLLFVEGSVFSRGGGRGKTGRDG